jgi:hypothetical protein
MRSENGGVDVACRSGGMERHALPFVRLGAAQPWSCRTAAVLAGAAAVRGTVLFGRGRRPVVSACRRPNRTGWAVSGLVRLLAASGPRWGMASDMAARQRSSTAASA